MPLVYEKPEALLAQINSEDKFFINDLEEEYLMFTAEIEDRIVAAQDGPHHTLRWRKKVRQHKLDASGILRQHFQAKNDVIVEETLAEPIDNTIQIAKETEEMVAKKAIA